MKALIKYNLEQDNDNALDTTYKGILNIINDDIYKISYTDENKILNTIEIDRENKEIKVTNINELYFKENKDYKVKYKTAYGEIPLKVVTKKIDINLDKDNNKLELFLDYNLYQGDSPLINKLNILVTY